MRSLVFLVAIAHCSAHLGPFHVAPWVLPFAKPITEDSAEAPTTLPSLLHPFGDYLGTPYLHPLGHHLPNPYILPLQNITVGPYGHPLYAPYLQGIGAGHLLGLVGYPPLGLPYVASAEEEDDEEEDVEDGEEDSSRRRRRDVALPLPYLHLVPTTKDVTVETTHFEPVDADTPADTTKIELTTKEHELTIPAVKYVQPHVSLKPFTYSVVSPAAVLPHAGAVYPGVLPHLGPYTGYPYPYPYPVASLDHD